MSYSTSSPGSETAPVPKRRVAALFAACLMLLTTAGVGVASTAGAAQPRPVANPGVVNVTAGGSSDPWGSIKVSWTVPVPSDFTTGYLVLLQKNATWVSGDAFTVYPVSGVNTTSLVISNLGWETSPLGGTAYSALVISTNGEASQSFIDWALSLTYDTGSGSTSFPPATTPTQPTPPPARYAFPTIDAMITAHYAEFLNRTPSFVERNLWQDIFQANGQNLDCIGVDMSTNPATNPSTSYDDPAMAWGPAPMVTESAAAQGAQNCPNWGTEYDMISILRTGTVPMLDEDGMWDLDVNSDIFWTENPTTYQGIANPIIRLYFAYFDRVPDQGGFEYWTNRFRNGTGSLDWIANYFATSPEFQATYPTIQTNADFVSMVYFNVMHRVPDANGMAYWTAQLRDGMSKGRVMNLFAQSDENIDRTFAQTQITNIYASLLQRMPTDNELAANSFWAGVGNGDGFGNADVALNVWVIQGAVRNSAEYAALQG